MKTIINNTLLRNVKAVFFQYLPPYQSRDPEFQESCALLPEQRVHSKQNNPEKMFY